VIGAEISATSVATSRHEREERVARALGISSAKGRSPGPRKAGRNPHGEIVSLGMGSATKRAMTHVRDLARRKSSALRANPGRCRNRVQKPTRRLPSPNRNRVRSRKLNTAKVVDAVVAVEVAESAENGPIKESLAHRAATEAIVAPKLLTLLRHETNRRSR
jgi:hypothetical protein